ncbi:hypothetical protein [Burkholderia cenocepacia]|uniref:hypothetical protein n=1 Tax=Burkholderia cenocepacia TaxID=95486 RepID=UPI000F59B668|nr:hypothetical protein [Burkholderia cenocepacia]MBR8512411.1 hypothetical protein [Burkholderia cenocepacia]RQV51654.1 hypothetical protein DF020_31280 [Burkholderia cenocepacia]
MSMQWHMRPPSPRVCGKPPSLWIAFAIYVVIQAAGVVITVLTWGPQPVASGDFFVRLLVLPLALTIALCGSLYSGYEQELNDTDWWNFLCRETQSSWRRWAQRRVVIVASTTITPEAELGERMLGLERPRPVNTGKRLPLANQDQASSEARLEGVLTDLLTPLSATIAGVARTCSMHVYLQSSTQDDLSELRQLWQRLRLPDLVSFSWVSLDTPLSLTAPWFGNDHPPAEFVLTLACQLHRPDQAPAWSEAAVALLTTSFEVMRNYRGKRRPQAYLLRPITAEADEVIDATAALLRAQQVSPDRIKHLWTSSLPGHLRHATAAAVKDSGLDLPTHDLDEAMGEPGPVSPLLLRALAAQIVQHGQGVQLVATPTRHGVQLNLIGTQLAPIEPVRPEYYRMLSLSATIGVVGVACLTMFGAETLGVMRPWIGWAVLALVILMFPIQIGGSILNRRLLEDDFFSELQRSKERT